MNIFYVDKDPTVSAQSLVDSHVVKMILESAQLLSTAHRILDGFEYTDTTGKRKIKRWDLPGEEGQFIYKATHINHPSAKWVRESAYNYSWLYAHFVALMEEYKFRYAKTHACVKLCKYLQHPPKNISYCLFSQPPCAMDKSYIISKNAVVNYQNYYKYGKAHLHKWTKREIPEWLSCHSL